MTAGAGGASSRVASSAALVGATLATLAVALPTLLAVNWPPSATFFNQAASLIGWGVWLAVLALAVPGRPPVERALAALLGALALLVLAALAAPLWTGLPRSLALSAAGMIAAAGLAAWVGAALSRTGQGVAAFRALAVGLLVAGLAGSLIGIVQVFAPDHADGIWIARTSIPGRAVGNLRQPNHLSSLLLWSAIAAVWVGEVRWVSRGIAAAGLVLMLFGVVLTGSRTGALGTVVLLAWGVADTRLSRPARLLLGLAPVVYGLCWLGVSEWSQHTQQVFGGGQHISGEGDISSSRFGIWSNTLALIAAHPLAGVGFGEFNFAWSLTPFPGRSTQFFDHTHDLPLHLAVELGLPLAALVLGLIGWALWRALASAWRPYSAADAAQSAMSRAALVMVLMIGVHSLLEYPLWYAYFLLPAAFAFGLCLVRPDALASAEAEAPGAPATDGAAQPTRPLFLGALLLLLGSVASVPDYLRVVEIFAPSERAPDLQQRIEVGQGSWFFSHHADYAAATTNEHPGTVIATFGPATHYLLDSRLLEAWARALDERGDVDRSRYVAERLKEFRNESSSAFFEPCQGSPAAGAVLPFQCLAPTRALGYEDFR